ncbi:hypothetical protein ACFYO9_27460 [Streptomyces sp. NPDC005863]|uniref:hypothetical protein n=1 Tax=unclassified Streptomyces TaxID=2593676 RepID=UPI0033E1284A
MAKRKVRRRARKILGEDPKALVWCELHKPIPAPPKEVHRAAGKGRLKSRYHWLVYAGAVVFFFLVVPYILLDKFAERLGAALRGERGWWRIGPKRRTREANANADGGPGDDTPPPDAPFDGDWSLTAGRLLLRWYSDSPSKSRLVLLTQDHIHVAASPGRRLFPTGADDFRTVAEFPLNEAHAEGDPNQPRGYATFKLRFGDGSWLELGRLADPADADHFLRTITT